MEFTNEELKYAYRSQVYFMFWKVPCEVFTCYTATAPVHHDKFILKAVRPWFRIFCRVEWILIGGG